MLKMRAARTTAIAAMARLAMFGLAQENKAVVLAHAYAKWVPVVPVETTRGRFKMRCSSKYALRLATRFHEYEPEMLLWIDGFPENAVFWDVGANVGTFSLYAALRPGVRVLAFEPATASYAALDQNVMLNDLTDRISALPIALANTTRLDVLNISRIEAGGSFQGFGTELNQYGKAISTKHRQAAIGFSIDDFVRLFDPPTPTHVKIDVDGIEAEILRGGRKTLSAPGVQSMIVEIERDLDSAHNRGIFGLMNDLGFVPRPKASPKIRNVVFDRA